MGGLYAGYTPGKSSSGKSFSKQHGHHGGLLGGLGHFAENLGGDLKDAAVGIPMGVKNLATHPIKSGEAIGKQTWHDWSPLIHGHAKEWAHNFVEHPLNPILDVATIATLGLGGGARAAAALEEAGALKTGSALGKAAKLAKEGRIEVKGPHGVSYERTLSRSRGSAFRQALVHAKTGRANPWFNNHTYWEKLDTQHKMETMAGADYAMSHFIKAGKKLGTIEGITEVMKGMHRTIAGAAHPLEAGHDIPKGWKPVVDPDKVGLSAKEWKPLYEKGAHGATQDKKMLEDLFKNSHDRFLNPTPGTELRDGKGRLMIVPEKAVRGYNAEAAASARTLKVLVTAPTTVWKYAVLGLRPGFFTNNAVGNMVMSTLGYGPVAVHSWAKALGRPVAKSFRGEDSAFTKLVNTHYPGQRAAHMAGTFGKNKFERSKVGRAAQGAAPFTGWFAENKIREGLIEVELKKNPLVQKLHTGGRSWHEAMDLAHKKDGSLASHISRRIDNTMGNYHTYAKWEKGVRALVPFYGWQRAITRHTKNLAADRPTTFNLAAQQGQQGAQDTARILGDSLPDFMRGVIPLHGGKLNKEGRTGILSTQGINPYASDAEMLGALGAVTGIGNQTDNKFDLASLIGPIPGGAIEQLTGTKASGAPAQFTKHGLVAGIGQSIGYNLPETQLLLAAMGKLPSSSSIDKRTGLRNQKLYKKDFQTAWDAYLGVPIKQYAPKAGAKLKKKKKHG